MKNIVTDNLIKAITAQAKPAASQSEIAFLRDFYHRISGQDFVARRALEFRAAALRHRRLGQIRAPGESLVEIANLIHAEPPRLKNKNKPAQNDDDQAVTFINVITEDKPFIIDSLSIKLNGMRKTPHRITHPSFEVRRDRRHRLRRMTRFKGAPADKPTAPDISVVESYIQLVVDFTPENEHPRLLRELRGVMSELDIVVADWMRMRGHTLALAEQVENSARRHAQHSAASAALAEHGRLLRWLENHHFAFLGYAEIEVTATAGETRGKTRSETHRGATKINIDKRSALGVLRAACQIGEAAALAMLPTAMREPASPVIFTKSRQRSAIHRANYPDCILIEHALDADADPHGGKRRVSCILGFLASAAATLPTVAIPRLRDKTAFVLKESTLRPGGHAYKSLQSILETLPREKLFQMNSGSLYRLCMTLLNHLERRKTRLHLHRNLNGHFYSCLVYVPRDLFNSKLRQRIQEFLGERLGADEVSFNVYFSDSILTRIHYLIHCRERAEQEVDAAELERAIQAMARDWNDNLHETIRQRRGHDCANQTLARYRDAFPAHYQDEFSVEQAIIDIARLEHVGGDKIHAALTPRARHASDLVASFKLYSDDQSIALSDVLPILRNMGIRVLGERPYRIRRQDDVACWLYDFEITRQDGQPFNLMGEIKDDAEVFQTTFTQAWHGRIEDDGFNQLTLLAGLNWKEISLLRACFRYLKQIRLRYSERYTIEALTANPALAACMFAWFNARLNPAAKGAGARKIKSAINRRLEQVSTLDEDRIMRALLDVLNAITRTNYFQLTDSGDSKPCLALKLNAGAIPRIPEPAPKYEIFICSPRLEGVHLRGGDIARGGLRWSERPEDFRTEVLGLVKAQRVKNAVIVPVGSKGGFVAKQLPDPSQASRDEIQREVIACYRLFISGLLDLTDNLVDNRVMPPKEMVRMDGDDPYLVVAADKGTATFSDIANSLSEEYGFWLGDAFASGGSAGYDHKKMGITARGAWESVKRHFRELGKDIQNHDFSVVGIGDMAGDVFGNGMLLSKHIRLLAAFNHLHIFIDPAPDSIVSHQERRRLFKRPRSAWSDYNPRLISAGGGVFERSAKSIKLSSQAKKALGASKDRYAPHDLINLILKADVELLWNGGIGTYVKASSESDAAAQDQTNDNLRVNASQLRCKVVGEGGNLGMTQLARIEYAQRGGLCYTDAIDNSAGVDTSDHEVNIKILLNAAIQAKLLAPAKRNAILAKMETEIGHLVLRNNYVQTQIISLEAAQGERLMPQHGRAIGTLERKGLLNRAIEFLPPDAVIKERFGEKKWLTRAEISVLLSYSKMDLYQALLDSNVPDDAYLATEIDHYFPALLAKKYPAQVRAHRLKREIISTQITNNLVGAMGPSFHLRMTDLTGCEAAEITRAYLIARDILDAADRIAAIEALDNKITAEAQTGMQLEVAAAVSRCVAWLLQNQPGPLNIQALVAAFRPGCAHLKSRLKTLLGKTLDSGALAALEKRSRRWRQAGAPTDLASDIAALPALGQAVDIIALAMRNATSRSSKGAAKAGKRAIERAAGGYFQVRETLRLDWLERAIDALPAGNEWHQRAQFRLGNDLRASHAAITAKALSKQRNASTGAALEHWLASNRRDIKSIAAMTADLKAGNAADFAMLSVLLSELTRLH